MISSLPTMFKKKNAFNMLNISRELLLYQKEKEGGRKDSARS
jgi:hypothetical protein